VLETNEWPYPLNQLNPVEPQSVHVRNCSFVEFHGLGTILGSASLEQR
jgi:hypothetical protein